MRIFISWSGELSRPIANVLHSWLPLVNHRIAPYVSTEIEKGTRWSGEISAELASTDFGIVVLTRENTRSPWLHFEAGALAKAVDRMRVWPILFGLKASEIEDPLALFQVTMFEEVDMRRLVTAINKASGEHALTEELLDRAFKLAWPNLTAGITPLLAKTPPPSRSPDVEIEQVLQELLKLNRQQIQILGNPQLLFGEQVISIMVRMLQDAAEGTLAPNERHTVMALLARESWPEEALSPPSN